MAYNIPIPFGLRTPQKMNVFEMQKGIAEAPFHGRAKESEVIGKELENVLARIKNEYAREDIESTIAGRKASTRHTHAAAHGLEIGNKYAPRKSELDIRSQELKNAEEEAWAKILGPYLEQIVSGNVPTSPQQISNQAQAQAQALQQAEQSQGFPAQPLPPGADVFGDMGGVPQLPNGVPGIMGRGPMPQGLQNPIPPQIMEQVLAQAQQPQAPATNAGVPQMQDLQQLLQHPILGPMLAKRLGIPQESLNLQGPARAAKDMNKLMNDPSVPQHVKDEAWKQYQLQGESADILNKYRKSLVENAGKKASTTIGKHNIERDQVMNGIMPGSDPENPRYLNEAEQNRLLAQYDNELIQQVSDAETRSKVRYATNVEKTINNIDIDALTQYAGIFGNANKKLDEIQAMSGAERENYMNYRKSYKNAQLLARQVRQFYGASVQENEMKHLEELTNPASWLNNPKVAKAEFESFANTMGQEIQTFRDSIWHPMEVYGPQEVGKAIEAQSKGDMITIQNPKTGETKTISKAEYEAGRKKK